jgi:alkylation response protein AidB-like acyl-CoA dehydrogenase
VVGALSALLVACFGALNKRLVERRRPADRHRDRTGRRHPRPDPAGAAAAFVFPAFAGPCCWCPAAPISLYLLLLALGCTLLPFALSLVALRHMSAFSAQLAVNLEPVYAIVLAIVLLGEQRELAGMFYLGVAVILTPAQQAQWLAPLLAGEIRSCFAMTEPEVASSDATNIRPHRAARRRVRHQRPQVVDLGRQRPALPDHHRHGQDRPRHPTVTAQSMILVPMDTPGVRVLRHLPVFGYDDAPHGHAEMRLRQRARAGDNILLGEGRGFEIAQGRLGPGRIHHCMRLIGLAERALEADVQARVSSRKAFGRLVGRTGRDPRAHRRGAHPASTRRGC